MNTAKVIKQAMNSTCIKHNNYAGQPVGWCISDTETAEAIGAFLGAIQSRSSSTRVNVVMTDDGNFAMCPCILVILYCTDNTGWSAAKGVFEDSLKHVLCYWHVDR